MGCFGKQDNDNETLMHNMGYVVVRQLGGRNRARGKKGEIVKGVWPKSLENHKVYFRVDWCNFCRKYKSKKGFIHETESAVTTKVSRCRECFVFKKNRDWNKLSPHERAVITSANSVDVLSALLEQSGYLWPSDTGENIIPSLEATNVNFKVSYEEMRAYYMDSTPDAASQRLAHDKASSLLSEIGRVIYRCFYGGDKSRLS